MNNRINPIGLKGNQINERMKQLMGVSTLNENKSNIVVELTKIGPDGKAYAIVRENHEYYIKTTDKTSNIVSEDFKYIGGLQNKKKEAYGSYAKAIKFLNLKFNSLAEAYDKGNKINAFLDDNLISEDITGFQQYQGNGFSNEGNMEDNTPLYEEDDAVNEYDSYNDEPDYSDNEPKEKKSPRKKRWDDDDDDNDDDRDNDDLYENEDDALTEVELAVENMGKDDDVDYSMGKQNDPNQLPNPAKELHIPVTEHKLSISRAIENMDAIINSLSESKKKVYTLK